MSFRILKGSFSCGDRISSMLSKAIPRSYLSKVSSKIMNLVIRILDSGSLGVLIKILRSEALSLSLSLSLSGGLLRPGVETEDGNNKCAHAKLRKVQSCESRGQSKKGHHLGLIGLPNLGGESRCVKNCEEFCFWLKQAYHRFCLSA